MADLFASDGIALPFSLPDGDGFDAAWNDGSHGFDVTVPGGEFFYAEHFFPKSWSDRTFAYLQEIEDTDRRSIDWRNLSSEELDQLAFRHIRWKQDSLKLYG